MTRKAVLCGINDYSYAPLRGCINDVDNIYQLLVETFHFSPSDIHLLTDAKVTKPNIRQEWQWLTQGAQEGDTLVFHFSGHGSHVPDLNGDEQDLRDEISCLCDMNFNNPNTYITDDEWYDLAQQVNPSANLILIKDTCHSGGSSRFLGVRTEAGKDRVILADVQQLEGHTLGEVIAEHEVTNARFLVPPDLSAEEWYGGESRRGGAKVKAPRLFQLNQTSLLACMETQTAADAYINGDFHGAFTYYLCHALRQNPRCTSRQLIETVVQHLKAGYTQIPQHEGKDRPAPIFGLRSDLTDQLAPPQDSLPHSPSPLPAMKTTHFSETTQQMLIQAHMKFLDTIAGLHVEPAPAAGGARTGGRVLVTVHGISKHLAGYSKPWWQALAPHVGTMFEPSSLGQGRQEVLWSDLVNQRSGELFRSLDADEMADLRQSILDVIEDRRDHTTRQPQALEPMPAARGSALSIDDFLIYMLNDSMRHQIIQRFTDVVRPLLASGTSLDIISHSWGTVVAYEGLRELEQQTGLVGRVANWFTVGSALSLAPVQGRLRPENRPSWNHSAPYPTLVDNWVNLDAQGDLVGGRLSRKFPVTKEFLNLHPVACQKSFWGYNLVCAHSSYFNQENLEVNRDIFAAHILAAGSP